MQEAQLDDRPLLPGQFIKNGGDQHAMFGPGCFVNGGWFGGQMEGDWSAAGPAAPPSITYDVEGDDAKEGDHLPLGVLETGTGLPEPGVSLLGDVFRFFPVLHVPEGESVKVPPGVATDRRKRRMVAGRCSQPEVGVDQKNTPSTHNNGGGGETSR